MHDKLEQLIDESKRAIQNAIQAGAGLKDVINLSDMMRAAQTMEEYLKAHETDANPDEHGDWFIERIMGEIRAAETYYQKWLETKQPPFRQITLDELNHAEILIKQAQEQGVDSSKLQALAQRSRALSAKLA